MNLIKEFSLILDDHLIRKFSKDFMFFIFSYYIYFYFTIVLMLLYVRSILHMQWPFCDFVEVKSPLTIHMIRFLIVRLTYNLCGF